MNKNNKITSPKKKKKKKKRICLEIKKQATAQTTMQCRYVKEIRIWFRRSKIKSMNLDSSDKFHLE